MSKNSKHTNVTETLSVENRSLDGIVYHPTFPVLDSELNFISDLNSGKLQNMVRSKVPSGWLDADYEIGLDENYQTYGINTTEEPNTFYLYSKKNTPSLAVVNGWILQIGGSHLNGEDFANKITLNPTINNREDLVFLEVWKTSIVSNSTEGKPDVDKIWKYGNTQYGGTNLTDEIVNSSVGFQTTTRTQIQYQIRKIDNVDFDGHPDGINDNNNVFAQGGRTSNSTYTFTNAGESLDDYGLYIAGDGSDNARNTLKTVDGYVYAIPMIRIQRRNKTAFSIINQNGAEFSINDGVSSDRPDGLYYDQISQLDIEDLRHAVSFDQFNYKALLDDSFDELLSGTLKTTLQRSELESNLRRTNLGFYINKIANATGTGTNLITQPNSQQRYYSDVAKNKLVTQKFTIDDKIVGSTGNDWASSDVVALEVKSPSPTGTSVSTTSLIVKFKYIDGSGVESIRDVTGIFSGGGTASEIFTFGNNTSVDLTDENIYITYEIDYPQKGNKLTKPITSILRVHDVANNKDWGNLSVNDYDFVNSPTFPYRRETKIPFKEILSNKDYAYTYSIQTGQNYYGVGTLVSYFMEGNGTQSYTIPGTLINPQDTEYVLAAYDVDNLTHPFMNLVNIVRNVSNYSITVTLPYTLPAGRAIRFDVVVSGGILEYDERTQSLEDMGKVDWYEIKGNDTSSIVLKDCLFSKDPDELLIGAQREFYDESYKTTCYINNSRQFVDVTINPNTSFIHLTFSGPVSSDSTIRISLLSKKTLGVSDNLNIYYNYKEYKGLTAKTNFGTSANSFIHSKILYHADNLKIMTNGTGAINTSEFLPKKYENVISLLPLKDAVDGEFTGTVHTEKTILGGSYSINSNYNTPYKAGQVNYLTNDNVIQKRGTYKGGKFTSTVEYGETGIHKLIVAPLLEMVIEDGTGNFQPGEIALKVETNYLSNTSMNRITNFDSTEVNNSFDIFKIKGRPLIKKYSK